MPFVPKAFVDSHLRGELTYLALARYQLVSHPTNPSRLGEIIRVTNDLEKIATHSLITSLFFNNNTHGIASFINRIIVPCNDTNVSLTNYIVPAPKTKMLA